MKKTVQKNVLLRGFAFAILVMFVTISYAQKHWVGTWGTAPQLVEPHNNPPAPGLANNSLREIVQVSIGGKQVRLKLTNEFSKEATEIRAVELAIAKTSGSSHSLWRGILHECQWASRFAYHFLSKGRKHDGFHECHQDRPLVFHLGTRSDGS